MTLPGFPRRGLLHLWTIGHLDLGFGTTDPNLILQVCPREEGKQDPHRPGLDRPPAWEVLAYGARSVQRWLTRVFCVSGVCMWGMCAGV